MGSSKVCSRIEDQAITVSEEVYLATQARHSDLVSMDECKMHSWSFLRNVPCRLFHCHCGEVQHGRKRLGFTALLCSGLSGAAGTPPISFAYVKFAIENLTVC